MVLVIDVAYSIKLLVVSLQALLDCCQLLENLITRHRLGSQPDQDKVNAEWLAARCDGLCLKLR